MTVYPKSTKHSSAALNFSMYPVIPVIGPLIYIFISNSSVPYSFNFVPHCGQYLYCSATIVPQRRQYDLPCVSVMLGFITFTSSFFCSCTAADGTHPLNTSPGAYIVSQHIYVDMRCRGSTPLDAFHNGNIQLHC